MPLLTDQTDSLMADTNPAAAMAIINAVRVGDDEAFSRLVESFHPVMLRLAIALVGAPAAEAVAHSAWRRALTMLDRTSTAPPSLRGWLFSALIDEARNHQRPAMPAQFAVQTNHWHQPATHWPDTSLRPVVAADPHQSLLAMLAILPIEQQAVVILRDMAGCSVDEVNELLQYDDVPQRRLLHQARQHLYQALNRQTITR